MITHSKNLSLSNYCLCFQKSGGIIKVRNINNEENIPPAPAPTATTQNRNPTQPLKNQEIQDDPLEGTSSRIIPKSPDYRTESDSPSFSFYGDGYYAPTSYTHL